MSLKLNFSSLVLSFIVIITIRVTDSSFSRPVMSLFYVSTTFSFEMYEITAELNSTILFQLKFKVKIY